jgi:peptidoglycan-N-acetylglucosamine deacetylase
MTRKRLCALSVDLDPLNAYYAIHGLGDPPLQLRYTILRKALPRFEELFDEAGVRATLFVVGREVEGYEPARETLRRMAVAGHELANHTYSHHYDLGRLPEQVIEAEIRKAHRVIVESAGAEHAPTGFRSPGYGIGAKVLRVISERGYTYDSSMLPSPAYYLAKLAVFATMAARGRRSASIIADPRELACPGEPYRLDPRRPYRRGAGPVLELPVATIPWLRIPAIGTLLAVSPERVRTFILAAMRGRSFFNLELHGIDLSDAVADSIPTELAGRQPDVRVPFTEKRAIFLKTIAELKEEVEFITLREATARFERDGRL